MHPNDTLNGKLLEWERSDQKHLRNKFGYWRMVEERMVRAQMVREGKDPDGTEGFFEIQRRIRENHANDEPYRAKKLSIQGIEIELNGVQLTPEERAYLRELFEDANNPLARSIYEKVR